MGGGDLMATSVEMGGAGSSGVGPRPQTSALPRRAGQPQHAHDVSQSANALTSAAGKLPAEVTQPGQSAADAAKAVQEAQQAASAGHDPGPSRLRAAPGSTGR